jgi:hypothetical protein
MSLSTFFGFKNLEAKTDSELPEIFSLGLKCDQFVDVDVMNIYSRILIDCLERTQGITDKVFPLLWDNCLQNEAPVGLVTLLAQAMTNKTELFLVYKKELNLLRPATTDEATLIREDYRNRGDSALGIYVSFKNYSRTDMVKIYSSMEYCVVASLNKTMNLSKAIQFKMSEMRSSVSLTDSSVAKAQAKDIATALANGKDVLLDKNDEIFTATPDISPIERSIDFLDAKKSFYYGMPMSYIDGAQTAGIGSTGEADSKAVERGLKQYYISIVKPVIESLFGVKTSFKSNDFRQIGTALEAIKIFELTNNELISQEDKKLIIQRLFDIEDSEVQTA